MKNVKDVEICWQPEQANHFDAAIGYYELEMLDEAEAELNKIDPSVAADSVPVIALQLGIAYSRNEWKKMKALARRLYLLEPSNPQWSFADGYSTAKIDD